MLRIPKCLRSMFRLRAKEPGRYALHGVFVVTGDDGRQHVQVTDGRVIASATLARDEDDDRDPAGAAVVSASDLDDLCRLKPKDKDVRLDLGHADGKAVPAVFATMAGDLAGSVVQHVGAWPATDGFWPGSKAEARIALDPDYLIAAIKAAKDASAGGAVVLTIYRKGILCIVEPTTLAAGLDSFHAAIAPVAPSTAEGFETRAYPRTGWVPPPEPQPSQRSEPELATANPSA